MTWTGFAVLFRPSHLAFMARGLWMSAKIGAIAIVVGFTLGVVFGVMRFGAQRKAGGEVTAMRLLLARLAAAYVEAIRNLPSLLLILIMFLWGRLSGMWAGGIGLGLFTGSVVAEIVRGGLNGVDRGQWEAATAQGLTYVQSLRLVILPQALKRVIPPLTGQFITVLKDTAYVGAIAVVELTEAGKIIFNREHNPLETFFLIALVYFVINYSVSRLAQRLERRLAAHSF